MAAHLTSLFTCFLFAADPTPAGNDQFNPALFPTGGPPIHLSPAVPENARSAATKAFLIWEIAVMFLEDLSLVDLTRCLGVCRWFNWIVRRSTVLRPVLINDAVRNVLPGQQMQTHHALKLFWFQPEAEKRLLKSPPKQLPAAQAVPKRRWFRHRSPPRQQAPTPPYPPRKRLALASKTDRFAWQVNRYHYRSRGCEIMFTRVSIAEEEERFGPLAVVPRTSVLYESLIRPRGQGLKVHEIDENDVIGGLYFEAWLDHDDYVSWDGATIGKILDVLEDRLPR